MGAQAATDSCLFLCYFEAIRQLPLGDFGAITFSSPAFTMMLSIFLLKDHCGLYRIMIATLLTVGVVVISRHSALFSTQLDPTEPSANVTIDASENPVEKKTNADVLGVVFALTGAVLSAWVTILARQVNHIHFSVQILWFSLSGVITSLLGKFMIDNTTYLLMLNTLYQF